MRDLSSRKRERHEPDCPVQPSRNDPPVHRENVALFNLCSQSQFQRGNPQAYPTHLKQGRKMDVLPVDRLSILGTAGQRCGCRLSSDQQQDEDHENGVHCSGDQAHVLHFFIDSTALNDVKQMTCKCNQHLMKPKMLDRNFFVVFSFSHKISCIFHSFVS